MGMSKQAGSAVLHKRIRAFGSMAIGFGLMGMIHMRTLRTSSPACRHSGRVRLLSYSRISGVTSNSADFLVRHQAFWNVGCY